MGSLASAPVTIKLEIRGIFADVFFRGGGRVLNLKTDRVAFSGRRGCQGGAGARGRGARGRFGAIERSSTRTSFSLGLVSFRSASKVRAESVRSGPCAWRDRTGRGQRRRCHEGTLGKSEVTCFPSVARFGRRRARGCRVIRANRTASWIAVWVKIRTLGKSASATSTSPKLTGEKTWGRWKETKRRQSICARGCRRRTRAWGAEVPDTSRRVEDLMHMGRR